MVAMVWGTPVLTNAYWYTTEKKYQFCWDKVISHSLAQIYLFLNLD
jgi:hypothetical protein